MRRRINQVLDPVMSVETAATKVRRLVYLLVANRPIRYGKEYSRIIYIGTTERGVSRIASSASKRIVQAVEEIRGMRRIDAYVVWARARQGKHTHKGMTFWRVLERALLLQFTQRYGTPPRLNGTGHNMKPRGEFLVFRQAGVDRIISRYT